MVSVQDKIRAFEKLDISEKQGIVFDLMDSFAKRDPDFELQKQRIQDRPALITDSVMVALYTTMISQIDAHDANQKIGAIQQMKNQMQSILDRESQEREQEEKEAEALLEGI